MHVPNIFLLYFIIYLKNMQVHLFMDGGSMHNLIAHQHVLNTNFKDSFNQ
jgi:hypothetical protein